jgi:hypothetical protein
MSIQRRARGLSRATSRFAVHAEDQRRVCSMVLCGTPLYTHIHAAITTADVTQQRMSQGDSSLRIAASRASYRFLHGRETRGGTEAAFVLDLLHPG